MTYLKLWRFIKYQLPVIIYGTIIFIQSSLPKAPTLPGMPKGTAYVIIPQINFNYFLHVMEFGLFGILLYIALANISYYSNSTSSSSYWLQIELVTVTIIGSILYGVLDEVHQSFVPGRTASLYDIASNTIGSIMGVAIFNRYKIKIYDILNRFKSRLSRMPRLTS